MGNYNRIVFKTLMEGLGQEYLLPPPITDETVRIGTKYSHEFACQPFRVSLGDNVRAIRNGANAIVMCDARDACRYRYFWSSQKRILEEIADSPIFLLVISVPDVIASLQRFAEEQAIRMSRRELYDLAVRVNLKIDLYDALGILHRNMRLAERERSDRLFHYYFRLIDEAREIWTLKEMFHGMKNEFQSADCASRDEPESKIMLCGAIYEVLEPIANNHLEDILWELGVLAMPMLNYHQPISFMFTENESARFCQGFRPSLREAGKRFIGLVSSSSVLRYCGFGGCGAYSIGCAACAKDLGYGGVIHLYPFGCMPEIIAKPFLKEISVSQNIPILSIATEENNSAVGYRTKIEAFIDLVMWEKGKGAVV